MRHIPRPHSDLLNLTINLAIGVVEGVAELVVAR
jgi:hypothetical protein